MTVYISSQRFRLVWSHLFKFNSIPNKLLLGFKIFALYFNLIKVGEKIVMILNSNELTKPDGEQTFFEIIFSVANLDGVEVTVTRDVHVMP